MVYFFEKSGTIDLGHNCYLSKGGTKHGFKYVIVRTQNG